MGRPRVDLEYAAFYPEIIDVSIEAGTSLSSGIDLDGLTLVGMLLPSGWDGTEVTFQVSLDGSSWHDLYGAAGNEVRVQVAPSRYVTVDPTSFVGIRHLRLRSGTTSDPVDQTATRTLRLVTRAIR